MKQHQVDLNFLNLAICELYIHSIYRLKKIWMLYCMFEEEFTIFLSPPFLFSHLYSPIQTCALGKREREEDGVLTQERRWMIPITPVGKGPVVRCRRRRRFVEVARLPFLTLARQFKRSTATSRIEARRHRHGKEMEERG